MLKLHVDRSLKLQKKYGWMMDSYVLDFFTDNLWGKLPQKWRNVLGGLQREEIAFFLLEMYSPLELKQKSQKLRFRTVWPLELLAFIASCHALKLNNQTWIDKFEKTQNTIQQNIEHNITRCINTETTESKANITSHAGNTQLKRDVDQTVTLNPLFQRNIKPKKLYEIEVLSKVICEQTEKLQCWNIVDVGAGLGHLSRLLSYGYKLRVVTVEGDGCHQSGAEKIDQKVLAHLEKKAGTVSRSLVHVTHHINADISAAEFTNVVLEAFTSMDSNTPRQNATNLQAKSFLIVGLHTCGDLATTLLRVFSQCDNAVGIVLLGCCYMKLTREIVRTDQGTIAMKKHGETFSECRQTVVEDLHARRTSETEHGELKLTPTAENGKILGYPMSDYVKTLSGHQQTYNALESACHAIERYHKKLLETSPTLKLHYYRALLELLLKQKDPGCHRRQIRTLRTKKATKMTLAEYVTSACDILYIREGRPTSQDIETAEEVHAGMQFNVVVFYVLRLLMAPVIEGLLLLDRLIYIKEKHPGINARITMLFDPDISPRNFAIIAEKNK